MEHVKELVRNGKFASRFAIDNYCYMMVSNGGYLHATVTAVKFTKGKVLYDLSVQIDLPIHKDEEGKYKNTRMHGIDEAYVISVEDFDMIRPDLKS